jgi:1-phosphofructokinase
VGESRKHAGKPRAVVFAPAPVVTVTIEATAERPGSDELHFHAGGQGFWVGRMLAVLGLDTVLCGTFGGEVGDIAYGLARDTGMVVRPVWTSATNGAYVHDRRSGEREEIATMHAAPLSRHEIDEFYGTALVEGLDSEVCVLVGGGIGPAVVPPSIYRRLANDLTNNGKSVIADLSGEPLEELLDARIRVVKVSDEEMVKDGLAKSDDEEAILDAMQGLSERGTECIVVTRADKPTLALFDGALHAVNGPKFQPLDPRGAGDSMTAGIAAALARSNDVREALRLGAAAGAMNVTRRGLASGHRDHIERLAAHIDVQALRARDGSE